MAKIENNAKISTIMPFFAPKKKNLDICRVKVIVFNMVRKAK